MLSASLVGAVVALASVLFVLLIPYSTHTTNGTYNYTLTISQTLSFGNNVHAPAPMSINPKEHQFSFILVIPVVMIQNEGTLKCYVV